MVNTIAFDRTQAQDFVTGWQLWPTTGRHENAVAQEWWIGVLERVLDTVNGHNWHGEGYPEDKYTEFSEAVVAQWVAQARVNGVVLTLCELSGVGKVLTDPFDDGVYSRLTGSVMESAVGYMDLADRARYDDAYKKERDRHYQRCKKLLTLGSVAEVYLEAAACDVARAWCEAMVGKWTEANPEPEENDEEE